MEFGSFIIVVTCLLHLENLPIREYLFSILFWFQLKDLFPLFMIFLIGKWESILKSASKKAHQSTHKVYNICAKAS